MAGPLGRILSSEWTLHRPDVTFLELGSLWDKDLWKRNYKANTRNVSCMSQRDVQDTKLRNKISNNYSLLKI
jgi:hypothetical protein